MRRGIFIAILMAAALPMRAGIMLTLVPDGSITDVGSFAGGTVLTISASGTVNLNGPVGNSGGLIVTNPDGSLNAFPPASCSSCWAPGYQYFLPAALGGTPYPTVAGGDGINHFPGGGANYDAFPDNHSAFAAQGKPTTDTTDPGAIRFGAIAGTFNPSPSPTDWFLVGNGGSFIVPGGGAHLFLAIADTYYPNNSGSYNVSIDTVPEPSVIWLALSGIAFLGLKHFRTRQR